jgi:hypothetical protein
MFLQNQAFNEGTTDRVNRLKAMEAIMQTILYYRDYAERARRLMESGDRRSILQTLAMLAQGFEEIANALEAGKLSYLKPNTNNRLRVPQECANVLAPWNKRLAFCPIPGTNAARSG